MNSRATLWLGLGLVAAGLVTLMIGGIAGAAGRFGPGWMMGGGQGSGAVQEPGSPGFVAGTVQAPRIVEIVAMPQLRFTPALVPVQQGETITFRISTMGPIIHEFMVGPAADVATDRPGTPEVADIGMMETRSLTYTFDGPGPYAFACHAAGHYEAGMKGIISVVR